MKINWKYAMGEIAIVMVGITLAFWLNNWGTYLANNKTKKEYLKNLLVDLAVEASHLEKNTLESNEKTKMIDELRPYLNQNLPGRDSMVRTLFQIANLVSFRPENTTYQTLINSGDLKLIDDFDLRRNIEDYYTSKKELQASYDRVRNIHQKYLADFFIHEMDYKEFRNGNFEILSSPLLANILSSIEGAYYLVLQANQKFLQKNKELSEQIGQVIG